MKNLALVVHSNMKQDLADQLRSMQQISGFSFSNIEGHGVQVENDPFLSVRDKVVGFTPRVRVDILLEEADVEPVLEVLRTSVNGIVGHGIYWLTAVEKNGYL